MPIKWAYQLFFEFLGKLSDSYDIILTNLFVILHLFPDFTLLFIRLFSIFDLQPQI